MLPVVTIKGANVVEIEVGDIIYLQSYSSIVAAYKNGKLYLGPHWDYSKTTAKHVAQFTGLSSKVLRKMIKDEEVEVMNLGNLQ